MYILLHRISNINTSRIEQKALSLFMKLSLYSGLVWYNGIPMVLFTRMARDDFKLAGQGNRLLQRESNLGNTSW